MSQHAIKKAFERSEKALTLKPSIGRGTARTTVRLGEGLACEARDGRWNLTVDMSEKSGGSGAAPDPGVFGRTALGSCLAIGYAKWAAVRGLPIRRLEVEVQADYDAAREYGVGDELPGYSQVRYVVTVESDAGEDEIVRLLDEADSCSPWLGVFLRPIELRRELRVLQPEE
jgi:uncharacterized OsmC-like protein